MKSSKLGGLIVAGLILALAGCEPPKAPYNEPEAQAGIQHLGKASPPEPPIEPSMVPQLPSTAKGDMAKKEEAKPEEKKAEEPAKAEAPK